MKKNLWLPEYEIAPKRSRLFIEKMLNEERYYYFAELLVYLDKKDRFRQMRIECNDFLINMNDILICKFPPFTYSIEVDVMDLTEFSGDLAMLLKYEPIFWREICVDIVYSCMRSVDSNNIADFICREQVNVALRVKSVPQPLVITDKKHYSGFFSVKGLLVHITKPTSYITHSIWCCPEECEGSEVIVKTPQFVPKCHQCKTKMYENSNFRKCDERVKATFITNTELLPRRFYITEDQIHKLVLGVRYLLTGTVVKDYPEIWSVEPLVPMTTSLNIPLPLNIEELYHRCNGSTYSFISSLASRIGVNVAPASCFMHMKICLLLSLVSVKSHKYTGCRIVHVLVSGCDSGYVPALMEEASKYADRCVSIGSTNASVVEAVTAACHGLAVFPLPWDVYKNKVTYNVCAALERDEVSIESQTIKLQTAVWAQCRTTKKQNSLNAASLFTIVTREDFTEYDLEIVEARLKQAVTGEVTDLTDAKRTFKDMYDYLELVSGLKVSLTEDAEDLLRKYFMAARKDHPGIVHANSIQALTALSCAAAQLCGARSAEPSHVTLAIWLHIAGSPEPRSAPSDMLRASTSLKEIQLVMAEFGDWLNYYVAFKPDIPDI